MTVVQQALDLGPNTLPILGDRVRRETHHAPAVPLHDRCPPRISFRLKRMMVAVDRR
jgi:hypothetical protein